jgi:hypothetical protein
MRDTAHALVTPVVETVQSLFLGLVNDAFPTTEASNDRMSLNGVLGRLWKEAIVVYFK